MKTVKIRDVEFEFSFTNPENLRRWKDAKTQLEKTVDAVRKSKSIGINEDIKRIESMIDAIKDFFSNIFGEEAIQKIFGEDCNDLQDYVDAREDMDEAYFIQLEAMDKRSNERFKKYAPVPNKRK